VTSGQVRDFSPPEEGELVAVDVDGTAVAVTVLDGTLHAFDDTCPHAGCSLADGDLDGRAVECPCHLARFDVTTGAVLGGPAESGIGIWSARLSAGTLELEEPPDAARSSGVQAASAQSVGPAPTPEPNRDITVVIEREHEAFRRQFEALAGLSDAQELAQAWTALVDLLEVHASGEEQVLYPQLVRAATRGAHQDEEVVEEAEHAVRDHNEIRDSVRAVQQHPVGSDAWWAAVRTAQAVNEDHLQEEERDVLPAFRDHVDRARREELGLQWVAFHEEHQGARGLSGENADPQTVLEQHDR